MNQNIHSQKFLRHRKFMLVLPLLALPFLALLFWSFGGGRGSAPGVEEATASEGINTRLPDAVLKTDRSLTKMSFYNQAASDSLKRSELMKTDPFFKSGSLSGADTPAVSRSPAGSLGMLPGGYTSEADNNILASRDPNEAKVYSRIEALNKAMNQASVQASGRNDGYSNYPRPAESSVKTADIDRLEQMMSVMKSGGGGEDPEMKQLDGMLDKIMDIQHPERVGEALTQTAKEENTRVLPVGAVTSQSSISLLQNLAGGGNIRTYKKDTGNPTQQNGFYSLDTTAALSQLQNALTAVIHETQSLVSGATVKMRLLTDITVAGLLIPKDNFVYGTAAISDERLKITIASVRYQNSIFPVKLSVYDMDGMEGIFVPGSISRDVARSSTDQALQGLGLSSLSPSLPLQAAGAGIQAAKTLISQKTKLVKVSVGAGYQVLLKASD